MPEFVQININVTEEDAHMVDRMMIDDAYDNRSAFIRRLIRQEWARRYSQPSLFTVEEAIQAGKAINNGQDSVPPETPANS